MVDAWPTSLPQRVQLDSTEAMADELIEHPSDTGPPITRLRSSAAADTFGCQLVLTAAQRTTLKTFVRTTLKGGSLPFTFPAQHQAGTWLVRFTKAGLPQFSHFGPNAYRATCTMLIMP